MANIYLHHIGSVSDEMTAASNLKKLLEKELDNVDGQVWIVPSIDIHPATGRHDIDIIMMGYLCDYFVPEIAGYSNIDMQSFFATIEVKSHKADGIHRDGTHLIVDYPEGPEDVTFQSNEQVKSIRKFLKGPLRQESVKTPFISNLIWLIGIDKNDFETHIPLQDSNILVSDSTAEDFFVAIGRQFHLVDDGYVDSFKNYSEELIEHTANIFCAKSDGADTMSLRRINILSANNKALLNLESNQAPIIILSGHAGTGKTVMLMQAAIKMTKKGFKCLFLTYNKALIADLKHTMLYFGNTLPAFDIQSMSSFLIGIMRKAGVWKSDYDINKDFESCIAVLLNIKESRNVAPDYDYIFVDEAQDWKNNEAAVLKYYYRDKHIVIADGIDQFMKSSEHTEWGPIVLPKLKHCLRQRANLVSFAKIFASKLGVYWDVESMMSLRGGRVIVTNSYDIGLHKKLEAKALSHGCTNYDIMFLAPNSLTTSGHFDLVETYKSNGINIFDGVDPNNREKLYSEENSRNKECRVYTYESCRGLEAWTTICLRFDQLFTKSHPHDYHEIAFSSARQYMLTLWSLIPLTRAVDTLVLGVEKGSSVWQILKEIYNDNHDYITFE